MNRIVIVGAGAMGCLFAARLARGGAEVHLLDVDPARIALINRRGIEVDEGSTTWSAKVPAMLAFDCAVEPDLVILFVKAMHSAAAIASVMHLANPGCHALTLQNGLGNAEILASTFGSGRTLLGVTDQPADLSGGNRVSVHGEGKVWLGGMEKSANKAANAICSLFNRSGISSEVVVNPQSSVWEKVAFNAALNATATITGARVGQLDCADGRQIATAVVSEVEAVARAEAIAFSREAVERRIDFALASHRDHMASMLQDRLAGRPTEIDAINGAIVERARKWGLDAPVNETLANLVRMLATIERGAGK